MIMHTVANGGTERLKVQNAGNSLCKVDAACNNASSQKLQPCLPLSLHLAQEMGVSENQGYLILGRIIYKEDPTMQGTIFESPIFGHSHLTSDYRALMDPLKEP